MPNRKKNGNGHRRSGPHTAAPAHPGEVLQHQFLEKHPITQVELAKLLGISFPRLNLILHGKRSITTDTALRLERIFGEPAEFWLDRQVSWDIYQVRHSANGRAIARIPRHPELRNKK